MIDQNSLTQAVLKADAWLESMRSEGGYGGPVVHWWQNCLQFTGAGLDWRYEGVIVGYITLYEKTGQRVWLERAIRAGDDLVKGQLPSGNYSHSSFELNPYSGGTPHEAAADIGLLRLALKLRELDDPRADRYAETARRNLEDFFIQQHYDKDSGSFRDNKSQEAFVPNKACTLTEALFALSEYTGDDRYGALFALSTLNRVMEYQVDGDALLDGAVYQNRYKRQLVDLFMPYYVARCVPGLIDGYRWSSDERYLDAAQRALRWVMRHQLADGSFMQAVYAKGRSNRYQQWVAGVGDILRAARLMESYGVQTQFEASENWLMSGQLGSGGFKSAYGFGLQVSQREKAGLPDFRDLLPVCGWTDKAFRYLALQLQSTETLVPDLAAAQSIRLNCSVDGQAAVYAEDQQQMLISDVSGKKTFYEWQKGEAWSRVSSVEMLWK